MFFYTFSYDDRNGRYQITEPGPAEPIGGGNFRGENRFMTVDFDGPGFFKGSVTEAVPRPILDDPDDCVMFAFETLGEAQLHQAGLVTGVATARTLAFQRHFPRTSHGREVSV